MTANTAPQEPKIAFFQTKRGRTLAENITAYTFLLPAFLVIFIFGIFPVAFAFIVSLHRWRRFPEGWRGLDNYVRALGDFAYIAFFWLVLYIKVWVMYLCSIIIIKIKYNTMSCILCWVGHFISFYIQVSFK